MSLNSENDRRIVDVAFIVVITAVVGSSIALALAGGIEWHEIGYAGAFATFAMGVYFGYVIPDSRPSVVAILLFCGPLIWLSVSIAKPSEYPIFGLTARGVAAILVLVIVVLMWYFGTRSRGHKAGMIEKPIEAVAEFLR